MRYLLYFKILLMLLLRIGFVKYFHYTHSQQLTICFKINIFLTHTFSLHILQKQAA